MISALRPSGTESRKPPIPTSQPQSHTGGKGWRGSFQRPVSAVNKGWVNSLIDILKIKIPMFFFSSFLWVLHLETCCHVTKINGRSGNEPKPFNPVFLYNANVFLPNIPKYANDHLQYKFSGSYTYQKCNQTFLKESFYAHKLFHIPASSSLTAPQNPFLCALLSSEASCPR